MKPINNLNLRDWSYIRRISGRIKLKRANRRLFGEIAYKEQKSAKNITQEVEKKKNHEELAESKRMESDVEN